jgi:hypothetical protein
MKFEQEMAREWPRISNPEGELLASRQARSVPSGGRGPGDAGFELRAVQLPTVVSHMRSTRPLPEHGHTVMHGNGHSLNKGDGIIRRASVRAGQAGLAST